MDLIAIAQGLTGPAAYAAVGGFALLESAAFAGLIVPGETAMLLGGALAALGQVSLPLMIAAAIVGAVLGDLVGYGIGSSLGPRLRTGALGRLVGAHRWDRADDLIRRRGPAAVFLGRWIGLARALVPAVAGATGMPLGRFLLWNVLGGTTWATTVLLVGYAAGTSWTAVQGWLGTAMTVSTAVLGALLVLSVLRRRRRRGATVVPELVPPVPVRPLAVKG